MSDFAPTLESLLTCPRCGNSKPEIMPTDSCQWFYECTHCHELLIQEIGDCCVFCSYGSVPCPLVQFGNREKRITSTV